MEAGMVPMTLAVAAVLGMGGDLEDGVYDFSGQNCHYCRKMDPIVRRLQRNNYPIRTIECESNFELVKRYNIATIPAFLLIINGQEKARLNGEVSQDALIQFCNRVPRPQEASDSLGAPAGLPSQPADRRDTEFPAPTATAPPKQAAPDKSGINWPFGSRKKEEPTRNPPANAIPRGKADDRQKIAVPVLGNPLAASVRIRVRDANGDSFGSGTIIDSGVGQTIIVTCGHIFRNWDKQAVIEIDWFDKGREKTMVGKRLYHDLKADVGLITINSDCVPSCRVAPVGTKIVKGSPVTTVGCSGGERPTVQHLKITALNRFEGPDNIEVGGMPVVGRSGGGLFTKDGELIGVCSGADEKYKEGYYIGLKTLHDLLDHCHLSRLYRAGSADENAAPLGGSAIEQVALGGVDEEADDLGDSQQVAAPAPQKRNVKSGIAKAQPGRRSLERTAAEDTGAIDAALAEAGEAEIVCIIRPVNQPGAASRVVILNRASRRFVEYLADELDDRPEILETTLKAQDEQPRVRKTPSTQKVKRPTTPDRNEATTVDAAEPKSPGPQAYRRNRSQ
jgi:thiol-disulfide isomerase/thioredoxin